MAVLHIGLDIEFGIAVVFFDQQGLHTGIGESQLLEMLPDLRGGFDDAQPP